MAEYGTEILAEQAIQFADSGMAGLYIGMFSSVVPFAIGKTYILVWNGTEYECTAAAASFNGVDGVGIGNFALAGLGEDTGEPFLLGTATDGSMTVCYSTASGSNTISVYLVEEDAPTVTDTLVLLDNQGIEQHLTGVKSLKVLTTGGAEQTFIAGETVEKTVNLDFSSGENMVVVPNTGKFFEKVTIIKPSSLVESNIAKDVDVAGIIGTHEGGDNETARIEFTYDEAGNVISASFVNMVNIPASTLRACSTVTEIEFSRSPNLTTIGTYAFAECPNLKKVYLPKSLKKIEAQAFTTGAISEVYYEGTLEEWLAIDFITNGTPLNNTNVKLYISGEEIKGTVVIPDGITKIAPYAFHLLSAVTGVSFPNSLIEIGGYSFRATGLTSIVIPDSVTTIGNYAFAATSTYTLTSAVVGSSVTEMGTHVFYQQKNLVDVTLKEGVKQISGYAFYSCSALKSITIPDSVEFIDRYAFYNAGLTSATFSDTAGWFVTTTNGATSGTTVSLSNTSTNATYLKTTYRTYYWYNT